MSEYVLRVKTCPVEQAGIYSFNSKCYKMDRLLVSHFVSVIFHCFPGLYQNIKFHQEPGHWFFKFQKQYGCSFASVVVLRNP